MHDLYFYEIVRIPMCLKCSVFDMVDESYAGWKASVLLATGRGALMSEYIYTPNLRLVAL